MCVCVCVCSRARALRIVSMDKILCFTNTLIIIIRPMSGLCSAYFEPYVCNSCPHNVRHCSALLSFKNKLKAFFFSHYFRSNYYLCSISMSYMCKWFEFIALNCTRRTLLYLYTDYCSSVNMYRMSVQGRRRALDKCTLFLLFERVINVHYYCYH